MFPTCSAASTMMSGFTPCNLPDGSSFSRFLSQTKNSELEELVHSASKLLIEKGHIKTDVLIGDSKPVENFDSQDRPICDAKLSMKYSGMSSDDKRTRMKYRCPIKAASKKERASFPAECPAGHSSFNTGKCYGCTAYVDANGEARSKVPRHSKHFKDTVDSVPE